MKGETSGEFPATLDRGWARAASFQWGARVDEGLINLHQEVVLGLLRGHSGPVQGGPAVHAHRGVGRDGDHGLAAVGPRAGRQRGEKTATTGKYRIA